jgi:hypothetical protein
MPMPLAYTGSKSALRLDGIASTTPFGRSVLLPTVDVKLKGNPVPFEEAGTRTTLAVFLRYEFELPAPEQEIASDIDA